MDTAMQTGAGPVEIEIDSLDEATLNIVLGGSPSGWLWTFAGPGHAKTIEQTNRLSRERLRRDADVERARNNGKQWKPDVETPDQIRAKNVAFVVERLIRFTPAKVNGELVEFSPEAATKILLDPRKGTIIQQAIDFLAEERSFSPRSAKIS